MRVNAKVRYAIRMMADIARHGGGQPVALKDVAERQDLSRLYLSQLAAPLKHGSLLKSVWGNKGGYVLARPATAITLLDIIEAVEGPVSILDCVLDPELCERSDYCECLGIWRDINQSIVRVLESHSLADLIGGSRPVARSGDLCVIRTGPEEDTNGRPSGHPGRGKNGQRQGRPARKR